MKVQQRTADGVSFWILEPETREIVRPVVHKLKCEDYFARHDTLRGFINGTFFDLGEPDELTVLGDVKTNWTLTGDVPLKSFNHQGDFFWSPAATSTRKGYRNRWAVAGSSEARMLQQQPRAFAEYQAFDWVMGGGACLLHNGEIPGGRLDLRAASNGGFSQQLKATQHSLILVTKGGTVHLGMNVDARGPDAIAAALQKLEYRDALMLDGGSAATLVIRKDGELVKKFRHVTRYYPVLCSGVGVFATN